MSDIEIKHVQFEDKKAEITMIRTTVFIQEQHVPEELEWDEYDETSVHFLAYCQGEIVGTARLLEDGRIGRMAILKEYRNRNIGKKMLKYIVQLAKQRQYKDIRLSAQEQAIGFYEKQGFSVVSDVYQDAGIPHFDMRLTSR